MKATIARRCFLCGKISHISCDSKALTAYENGALAQVAFADMDLRTRETIISGICVPCQIRFFEADDEDEE